MYVCMYAYTRLYVLYRYLRTGGGGGAAVAQLVEAVPYKPEGRGFDWKFSLT
jgi:hypothetical protein